MRKPSRELFEAGGQNRNDLMTYYIIMTSCAILPSVLGVFSPPLNSTDSKSEQNEQQSKLRCVSKALSAWSLRESHSFRA